MITFTKEEVVMLLRNMSAIEGGLMALTQDSKAAVTLLDGYMDYSVQLLITKLEGKQNNE